MFLHDVAVTQDNVRLVCVGKLTASSEGLHPSKCRAEKQIIGMSQIICVQSGAEMRFDVSIQYDQGRDREVSSLTVVIDLTLTPHTVGFLCYMRFVI